MSDDDDDLDAVATEAIERAYAAAPEHWKDEALLAIHQLAVTQPTFTSETIWERIGAPREKRALGGVIRRARLNQWITPTQTFVRSTRMTRHRGDVRIWQSLVYSYSGQGRLFP